MCVGLKSDCFVTGVALCSARREFLRVLRIHCTLVYPFAFANLQLDWIKVWTGLTVSNRMVWIWCVQVVFDRIKARTGLPGTA